MVDRFIETRDTWEPLEVSSTETGTLGCKIEKIQKFYKKN